MQALKGSRGFRFGGIRSLCGDKEIDKGYSRQFLEASPFAHFTGVHACHRMWKPRCVVRRKEPFLEDATVILQPRTLQFLEEFRIYSYTVSLRAGVNICMQASNQPNLKLLSNLSLYPTPNASLYKHLLQQNPGTNNPKLRAHLSLHLILSPPVRSQRHLRDQFRSFEESTHMGSKPFRPKAESHKPFCHTARGV